MTVVFNESALSFSAKEILWHNPLIVNALVESALKVQTEAFIEMIKDSGVAGDVTRASVNTTLLGGVKQSAQEFLADIIGDLQRAVEKRLESVNYGAAVTGIKYSVSGEITDIEVNVSVGDE